VSSRSWRDVTSGNAGLLLVPAAAFAVHQLRYSLAYGSRANAELAAQGHSYMHSLVPWLILTLGIGFSAFIRRAVVAAGTGDPGRLGRRSPAALWTATTVGLMAIYAVQESLEELLASGHPTGIGGVFGHGGWWAIPVSAAVALIVVALLRLGRSLLRAAASLAPRRAGLSVFELRRPGSVALVPVRPLARHAAGRAPPRC
jgi:hypothetical protein